VWLAAGSGGRLIKFHSCVNEASGPPLPPSLFAMSGAPEASPLERGWPRGAGQRIGPPRAERPFEKRD
jgi:hypothetical protein